MLVTLGWAEQQIKIELPSLAGRVDIACFAKPYKNDNDNCQLLIETKDFSSGLDYAPNQAKGYTKSFPSCKVVMVTNGYCYKTYIRDKNGSFTTKPSAYLNLIKPRNKYPIDPENVGGALEVLRYLLPGMI